MKLKMLGLLGALVFAVPVTAVAAPAGGMTAQSAAPMTAPAVETNAAVNADGPVAKVDKVWWRGGGWRGGRGFGWRGGFGRGFGWRGGFGYRRFGFGYGFRRPFFGGYYGYGFRRPFFRRRFWY